CSKIKIPTDINLLIDDLLAIQPTTVVPPPYIESEDIDTKMDLTYRFMLRST
ncbi:20436_t:CDS:1, partial [Cetraspora pellucida]